MNVTIRSGLRLAAAIAVGVGFWSSTSTAQAQNCGAGCGPLVGNSCAKRASDCGWLGLKIYPRMESRYIRQFCGPHIAPGSCFGYFKPKVTRWNDACPNYIDPAVDQVVTTPVYQAPAPTTAPVPMPPIPNTTAAEPKTTIPPIADTATPKPMPKIPDAVIPSKPPVAPPKAPAPMGNLSEQGLVLPPVPDVPVPQLPSVNTVSTTIPR